MLRRPQLSVHPIAMVGGEEAPGGAGADLGAPAAPTEVAEVLTQNKNPPKKVIFTPKSHIVTSKSESWERVMFSIRSPPPPNIPLGHGVPEETEPFWGVGLKFQKKIIKKEKKVKKKRIRGHFFLKAGRKKRWVGFYLGE